MKGHASVHSLTRSRVNLSLSSSFASLSYLPSTSILTLRNFYHYSTANSEMRNASNESANRKPLTMTASSVEGNRENIKRRSPRNRWKNLNEQRAFLLSLPSRLGLPPSNLSVFYNLSSDVIAKEGGRGLLNEYGFSRYKMLKAVFPEHEWNVDELKKKPHGHWKDIHVQRSFLLELGKKLNIPPGPDFEPWYKVTTKVLRENGGRGLLGVYGFSMSRILKSVFPEHPFPSEALYLGDDSRFQTKRQPHWKSPSKEKSNVPDTGQVQHSKLTLQQQQKNLLLAIGKTFGIGETEYEKWYLVTTRQFLNKGGYPLINSLGPTLSNVLANLLPEHPWDSGKFVTFVKKPHDYWKSPERQREYLLELGKKLGIKEGDYQAWYKVTNLEVLNNGGASALGVHKSSLASLLAAGFPEHEWDLSKFETRPHAFWADIAHQRKFLDDIGTAFKINSHSDMTKWYSVTTSDLVTHGGRGLLNYYGFSMSALLKAIYPDHPWDDSLFTKRPQSFWKSPENQRRFMEELGQKFGINPGNYDAWYKVTTNDLMENGASTLLVRYYKSSPAKLITSIFPEHQWDLTRFARTRNRPDLSRSVLGSLMDSPLSPL